jgi:hypothetical protein
MSSPVVDPISGPDISQAAKVPAKWTGAPAPAAYCRATRSRRVVMSRSRLSANRDIAVNSASLGHEFGLRQHQRDKPIPQRAFLRRRW